MPTEQTESGTYTPQSQRLRSRIAEALMRQGLDTGPVQHWAQGANRMLQALIGGHQLGSMEARERASELAGTNALASVLGGGPTTTGATAPAPTPAPAPAPQPQPSMDDLQYSGVPGQPPPAPTGPLPTGMARVTSPSGSASVTVNANAQARFRALLAELERQGVVIDPQQTGGYNNRNIDPQQTGGRIIPSPHASGNAVDVNWEANPRGRLNNYPMAYDMYGEDARVPTTTIHPDIARHAAERAGLTSGANWRNPDPMHFQTPPDNVPMGPGRAITAGLTPPAPGQPPPTTGAVQPPPAGGPQPPAPATAGIASQGQGRLDPQQLQQLQALLASPNPQHRALAQALLARHLQPSPPTERARDYATYVADQQARNRPVQSFQEWDVANRQASATAISNNQMGERREDVLNAEQRVAQRNTIQQQRATAQDQIGRIALMRHLMAQPNFYSGPGGSIALSAQQLISQITGNTSGAASMEAFAGQSNQAVMTQLGTLGANISNSDRDFVTGIFTNLSTTEAGNRTRLEIMERLSRRQVDVASFMDRYRASHGGRLDDNFDAALSEWREQNPVFSRADLDRIGALVTRGGPGRGERRYNPQTGQLE